MSEPRRMKPWRALRCPLCDHALHDGDHGIVLENGTIGCRVEMFVDIPKKLGTISSDDSQPQPSVGGEGVRAHDPQKEEAMNAPCEQCDGVGATDMLSDEERIAGHSPSMEACDACKGTGKALGDRRPLAPPEEQFEDIAMALDECSCLQEPLISLWCYWQGPDHVWCEECLSARRRINNIFAAGEARAAALQQEVDVLHNCGIIEIAVRNKSGSVSDYMNHWEGRALKAEAAIVSLQAELLRLEDVVARGQPSTSPSTGSTANISTGDK